MRKQIQVLLDVTLCYDEMDKTGEETARKHLSTGLLYDADTQSFEIRDLHFVEGR